MDKERQNKPYFHVGKELSNKFPGEELLPDTPKATAMANRAKLIGRQLQGRDGLANWALNYNDSRLPAIFTEIASRRPAIKLKAPRTNAAVTVTQVAGDDVFVKDEETRSHQDLQSGPV